MTDPDSDQGGGSAVGRAAWSRRPPLTRERKNRQRLAFRPPPPRRRFNGGLCWSILRRSCSRRVFEVLLRSASFHEMMCVVADNSPAAKCWAIRSFRSLVSPMPEGASC